MTVAARYSYCAPSWRQRSRRGVPPATRQLPNSRKMAQELLAESTPFIDLIEWLAAKVIDWDPGLSPWQAQERAEERVESLARAIDDELNASARRAVTATYVWQGSRESGTLVHLSQLDMLGQDGQHPPPHQRARLRDSIRSAIGSASFGNARFEHLCRFLVQVYGADVDRSGVTRPSGDGGVDFFGIYDPESCAGARRLATQSYRVAGQAKRWTRPVPKEEIEVFGARLDKWRLGSGDGWSRLPDWFKSSELPILGLFITSGTFERPALSVAAERVCLCFDGLMIAEDLAADPRLSASLTPSGNLDLGILNDLISRD